MNSLFNFLYKISISIVQDDGNKDASFVRKRAHRSVIIMSYMVGLFVSSISIYIVSLIMGTSDINAQLFYTTFISGLFAPYLIIFNFYIIKERYKKIYFQNNLSKYRFYLLLAYIFCHTAFIIILYFSSLIGR